MSNYNPNSIWGSKEKKYVYNGKGPQPGSLTGPEAQAEAFERENSGEVATDKPEEPMQKESFFKSHGVIWFGVGLILVLIAIVVIIVEKNHPSPQLGINFAVPSRVFVGDPFLVTVSFSNDSGQTLKNAQLSILAPIGMSFLGLSESQRVFEQSVGDISSGATTSTTFSVIATGNPNSVQSISATMTYGSEANATAQFESNGQTNIVVGDDALKFNFGNTPQSVFSGQNITMTVNYNNQSPDAVVDAQFNIAYPTTFSIVSSSVPYSISGNDGTWDLGTVSAGASSSFVITGNFTGPANTPYSLQGTIMGVFSGQSYPVVQQATNVTIAQAPLALTATINNSPSYIAKAGDQLTYVLSYANNSNVAFQSPNITAKLTGAMFDFSKLQTDGAFNSVSNTITWNAANDPSLESLAPGETGSETFTIQTKASYPIRLISDKNFQLKLLATITSPTVPPNTGGGTGTQSIVELDSKVGGWAVISAEGYHVSGPYPPKVNQGTTYAIHWLLADYSTDATNVTVSAYLQSGSSFTGIATSTAPSSTVTYDQGTGLVSWTIPFVPATTGVLGKPLEAIFQISNTPAVNQVNQMVTLLGGTTLVASDTFTGQTLTASDQPVTTQLPDDPSVANVSNKTVTQ